MAAPRIEDVVAEDTGKRVRGKVAVVTGAGSSAPGIGNGRATALLLARHGARVCLADFNEAAAEETARMIRQEGGECVVVQGDVSRMEDCRAIVAKAVDTWGRLDILVNIVGFSRVPGTAETVDPDAWDRGMQINVKSMVMMVRFAAPEMRKNGSGSIINIGSITSLHGGHPSLFYPVSKAAVDHLTRTMAGHHGPDGIRVNCVSPGFVYTPVVFGGGALTDEARDLRRKSSAMETEGTAWDIAYAILFLASDEARWITGHILPVDAGSSAISAFFKPSVPPGR